MQRRSRRAATRKLNVEPISVWGALNQPIVEVSGETARAIFLLTAVIFLAVWIAPYRGASTQNYELGITNYGQVAGASTESIIDNQLSIIDGTAVPEWYYVAFAIPGDVAEAFADAANDVLDISEPVQVLGDFYEPGVQAVTDAWLELMADPY